MNGCGNLFNTTKTEVALLSTDGKQVTIKNLAAGTASTDAVNVQQLDGLKDYFLDNRVKYVSVNSSKINPNSGNDGATGADSIAIGPVATAEGDNGTALGTNSTAGGSLKAADTTSIGAYSKASGVGATALGSNASSEGAGAVALGQGARTHDSANFAIALGYQAEVKPDATEVASAGIAIGQASRTTRIDGIALGHGAYDEVEVLCP